MHELGRIAATEYTGALDRRIRVVLDDVRSRHNVGAFFRTADAFGVEGLVLCGFTPLPPHREIEKTALGATASVPWQHAPDAADAVARLKAEGYRVIAVEQTLLARPLSEFSRAAHQPLALVFGNELNGVSDAVISACDECLVVPQRGSKHSLNVSVCAGVVLHWLAGTPIAPGH
ncbi:MAG: RNA methyltransferase [Flavobacteriales bacterium]|nr:RNA methyltransferase [Flavobacteriales bacterium]